MARPDLVLDRFEFDRTSLQAFHVTMLQRLAQQIVASWNTQRPIREVRLIGHTDPVGTDAYNDALGQRRALEVQRALRVVVDRLRPGLSGQISVLTESRGERQPLFSNRTPGGRVRNRRVEVFLAAPPAPTPQPPAPTPAPAPRVRIPPPEEAARGVEPPGPETAEKRVQRILKTPPPRPVRRPSFNEMFWRWVDRQLDDALGRFHIPRRLHGPVRDLLHRAIESGSESLLDRGLDNLGVTGAAKEAIKAAFRAALQQPVP